MDQRLNFVTLAVASTEASHAFYADGLGWQPALHVPGEVVFFQLAPTLMLSLWNVTEFEQEVGTINRGSGTAPITLAHNVPAPAHVDAVLETAVAAGARLIRAGEQREWGGYSGYFADPDGYRWEVAHNPDPIGVRLLEAAGVL